MRTIAINQAGCDALGLIEWLRTQPEELRQSEPARLLQRVFEAQFLLAFFKHEGLVAEVDKIFLGSSTMPKPWIDVPQVVCRDLFAIEGQWKLAVVVGLAQQLSAFKGFAGYADSKTDLCQQRSRRQNGSACYLSFGFRCDSLRT